MFGFSVYCLLFACLFVRVGYYVLYVSFLCVSHARPDIWSVLTISMCIIPNRGTRIPEPLLTLAAKCPSKVQIPQGLSPFFRIELSKTGQKLWSLRAGLFQRGWFQNNREPYQCKPFKEVLRNRAFEGRVAAIYVCLEPAVHCLRMKPPTLKQPHTQAPNSLRGTKGVPSQGV